jgi:hypothetical protein
VPLLSSSNGSSVSRSREIAASADVVYGLVSDLPRMGSWSPEAVGGTWVGPLDPTSGPRKGQRFLGANRHKWHLWPTVSQVTSADRGRRFAFHTTFWPFDVAEWSYDIVPVTDPSTGGPSCMVTETWTDRRVKPFAVFAILVTGTAPDRTELTRSSIDHTLAAIAAAATAVS